MSERPVQDRILDAAERLCQTRGYNGFSFRDLAAIVGMRAASIHYHFPTKSDLGKALIQRYRQKMETALGQIERKESTCTGRIRALAAFLRGMVRDGGKMCLCGILAAEAGSLPEEMRKELRRFFDDCEAWLASELAEGRARRELLFSGSVASAARTIMAVLEGAMMTSRAFDDEKRLSESAHWLLGQLAPG
ncbi:MAG: TetR/AcrR family transcriptional regulator [Phycisphaerales bacterium]|nr:TetR/AcrR family transcriptional regulator [Phycisphaerales bacterium]